MSPIRYIRTMKMNKVKDMLESEFSSVTDIACAPGYNDVYEFSRDFKKQVGVSVGAKRTPKTSKCKNDQRFRYRQCAIRVIQLIADLTLCFDIPTARCHPETHDKMGRHGLYLFAIFCNIQALQNQI